MLLITAQGNTMNTIPTDNRNVISRLHPLVAAAAVSVVLVSLLGAAALTGILPSSNANGSPAVTDTTTVKPVAAAPAAKVITHKAAPQQAPAQVATASPAPAQPAAAKENSVVGIGIGAVVGGLLGNQIGSGDGKTLATIAGAVGGGYVGNEIAKKQAP
jgi:uncharacterized protein YcfJ